MKADHSICFNGYGWVKMVNQFGEYFFAEDIVQETYIMLMKWSSEEKLFKDGNISKGYMWLALKNKLVKLWAIKP